MTEKGICKPDGLPYYTKMREEHGTTSKPTSDITPTAKIEPFDSFWEAPETVEKRSRTSWQSSTPQRLSVSPQEGALPSSKRRLTRHHRLKYRQVAI
jgi:hypothetical protein